MPPEDKGTVADDVRLALAEVEGREPAEESAPEAAPVEAAPEPKEAPASDGRARDEKGRFAKAEAEPELPLGLPPKPSGDKASPVVGKPLQPETVSEPKPTAPPHGWSVKAKQAWDKLDPAIREAVLARENEVNQGFSKFQSYKGLEQYADLAARSGTTLAEAMGKFVNLENVLRQDPAQGLVQVAQNLGWSQQQAAEAFAALAQRLGYQGHGASQPPSQGAPAVQSGAVDPNIAAYMQRVSALEQRLAARDEGDQKRLYSTAVSAEQEFRADPANRYYGNVEKTMVRLLESGMVPRTGDYRADLKTAYEQACQLHPEVREALINERIAATTAERVAKEKEAAAKAARASRSVSGSLAPGEMVAPPPRQRGESDVRADVRAALAQIAR